MNLPPDYNDIFNYHNQNRSSNNITMQPDDSEALIEIEIPDESPPTYEFVIGGYTVPPKYTSYVRNAKNGWLEYTGFMAQIELLFAMVTLIISALYYHSNCAENLQLFMILCSSGAILSFLNRCRFKFLQKNTIIRDEEPVLVYNDGKKYDSIASTQLIIMIYNLIISIWLIKLFFDTSRYDCDNIIYNFALTNAVIGLCYVCLISLCCAVAIIMALIALCFKIIEIIICPT